jgi:hypothetical protein
VFVLVVSVLFLYSEIPCLASRGCLSAMTVLQKLKGRVSYAFSKHSSSS